MYSMNYILLLQGTRAIWSPYTGIVDWGKVTKSYADDFVDSGGFLILKHGLEKIKYAANTEYPVVLDTNGVEVSLLSIKFSSFLSILG